MVELLMAPEMLAAAPIPIATLDITDPAALPNTSFPMATVPSTEAALSAAACPTTVLLVMDPDEAPAPVPTTTEADDVPVVPPNASFPIATTSVKAEALFAAPYPTMVEFVMAPEMAFAAPIPIATLDVTDPLALPNTSFPKATVEETEEAPSHAPCPMIVLSWTVETCNAAFVPTMTLDAALPPFPNAALPRTTTFAN